MTDIGLKQTLSSTLRYQIIRILLMELKALSFHTFMHHIHKTLITQVIQILNYFHILKRSVANLNPLIYTLLRSFCYIPRRIQYTYRTAQSSTFDKRIWFRQNNIRRYNKTLCSSSTRRIQQLCYH